MNTQNQSASIAATIAASLFPLAADDDTPVSMPLFKLREALRTAAESGSARPRHPADVGGALEDIRGRCSYLEAAFDLIAAAPATGRGGPDYLIGPTEVARTELQSLADQLGEILGDSRATAASEELTAARGTLLEARAVASFITDVGLDTPADRNMEGARGCARLIARQVETVYHQIDRATSLVDRVEIGADLGDESP